MTEDLYVVNAEYYDVVSAPMWDVLREPLARALAPLRGSTDPVVDLGAGTGAGTVVLAAAAPDAEVFAVEPSAHLRTGLMARVMADPDLRERVTVLPTDTDGALRDGLPERVGGLSALHMLGHLDPPGRRRLWAALAERLVPGGLAAVVLQPPPHPEHVPDQDFGKGVRVGRRTYRGGGGAVPAGDDQITWTMRWQVLVDDAVVEERTATSSWWTVSPAQLAAEARAAALTCRAADETAGLHLLRRA